MACNQYTVSFSSNATISFIDCSGFTQTFSGQAGISYLVFADSTPTVPPSGVSVTNNGLATPYRVEGCCGFFYFVVFSKNVIPNPSVIGTELIQFNDGSYTTDVCFEYIGSPITGDEPYVTVIQKTGGNDSSDNCSACATVYGYECVTTYFATCCKDECVGEISPPYECILAIKGKITGVPSLNINDVYTLDVDGVITCVRLIKPSGKLNYYSVPSYKYDDITLTFLPKANCDDCKTSNPCPVTPTPTPTTTSTPTPTPTPTNTPTPSSTRKLINECEPITIFDMGVSCVIVEPSTQESNDGAASVKITGGTPPYTITWDNGNIAAAIGNLSIGSYGATVVDFYGDFTAKTVCVLTGQTYEPTPTPTPTPTSIPSGPVFCMLVRTQYPKESNGKEFVLGSLFIKETFTVDSFVNGKPSWISNSGIYRIYFNTTPSPGLWEYSASTTLPVQIVNTNYSTIPLNPTDWSVLGGTQTFITITEGPCQNFGLSPLQITNPEIELYVVKNDTNCGCEGSIIANADGGNIPYQYSIDGGISYKNFPIFDDLCFGNYTVTVKDSLGYTKSTQITIDKPKLPTTYVVNLTKNETTVINNGTLLTKTYEVGMTITPPLPDSATIIFDIIHTNTFNSSITPNSASLLTNTILNFNGTPISYTTTGQTSGTSTNTFNGCQNEFIYTSATTEVWQGLTYTNSDELIINTTTSVTKNFTTGCDIGSSTDTFYVTNISITGCDCCTIQNVTL